MKKRPVETRKSVLPITPLSPLSPCFIPTLSSEPIPSSSILSLGGGSSLLRSSSLLSTRSMVRSCQSPLPPAGRQSGWGDRTMQKMGGSMALPFHVAHSPSFLRQTFIQEANNKSVLASSTSSSKGQKGKTLETTGVSLGDHSPLSSSSSFILL